MRLRREYTREIRCRFQFTHSGRGATRCKRCRQCLYAVSIHAPREGCDRRTIRERDRRLGFNSRTPGGVRHTSETLTTTRTSFNSRTPGGVRLTLIRCNYYATYCFNSRTPGGVRLYRRVRRAQRQCFNSRTPGGVRLNNLRIFVRTLMFQFTHPGRGATSQRPHDQGIYYVSIHAPREGCDGQW